jgi:hypothetical protein
MLVASPRKSLQYKLNSYNSCGAAIWWTRFEPTSVGLQSYFSRSGLPAVDDEMNRQQKNGCFKNIEDLREAGPSMVMAS